MEEREAQDLFDAGRIIGPEGPHGVVVRAAVVSDELRVDIGPAVAVKIVPIGDRLTATLRDAVQQLKVTVQHAALVPYHGVWLGPAGEAWIASDLCESGSIADVLQLAGVSDPPTLERIAAYVIRNLLLAVDALHAASSVHGDIRANNILIDGKGRVKVADYGVFHILEAAMRSRTTYPGARLWPAPEVSGRARSGAYTTASETWAVGIVAMELVEGRPSVQRMYQASLARSRPAGTSATAASAAISAATPALRDPTRWSPALRDFILSACRVAPAQRATAASLLSSQFIALADGGALAQAVAQAAALPTPARLQTVYDPADVAAKLHRRNNCVRAPLVLLDDLHAEDFIDPDLRADAAEKPAVELALRAALRNRARADTVGLGRGPEDLGGAAADAATRRLEVFLDTIDMSTRRTR